MDGPSHYHRAEQLLDRAYQPRERGLMLAEAQVHATLALAAATALPAILALEVDEGVISREWAEATS